MKIEWNKITWYSKLGALVTLVIMVSLGFYFWNEYQEIQDIKGSVSVDTSFVERSNKGFLSEEIKVGEIPIDQEQLIALQNGVDEGHQPWRRDPLSVLEAGSSQFGFNANDSFALGAIIPGLGEVHLEVFRNGESYDIILIQPIRKEEGGIWAVKSITKRGPVQFYPIRTSGWDYFGYDLEEFRDFFQNFQRLVGENRKSEVANLVYFGNSNLGKDKEEFIKNYDQLFNQYVKIAIMDQGVDRMFVNYQGIMVGNGQVWFSPIPGREGYWIIAINND